MKGWYEIARSEFTNIAGTDLKFIETRFKMQPPTAKTASPWAGESAASAFWRSLASRARDTANLVARPAPDISQRKAILSHMNSASRAILLVPKNLRDPLRLPRANWKLAFVQAVLSKSACWIASLAKLATTRAEQLERTVATTRARHWKTAIGAKAEEGSTRKPTPTRIAYRYLRTPTGWHQSPIGTNKRQNEVPDAPDQNDADTDEEDDTYE